MCSQLNAPSPLHARVGAPMRQSPACRPARRTTQVRRRPGRKHLVKPRWEASEEFVATPWMDGCRLTDLDTLLQRVFVARRGPSAGGSVPYPARACAHGVNASEASSNNVHDP